MIWGELKPNFGDIRLGSVSVLKEPREARLYMSVCPQDDAGTKRNLWKALQGISANCVPSCSQHTAWKKQKRSRSPGSRKEFKWRLKSVATAHDTCVSHLRIILSYNNSFERFPIELDYEKESKSMSPVNHLKMVNTGYNLEYQICRVL